MNMREIVAKALYEQERKRGEHANEVVSAATGKPATGLAIEPWEECRDTFLADAGAVLAAMMEPTEAMIAAARNPIGASCDDELIVVWQAMLSAAQQEG